MKKTLVALTLTVLAVCSQAENLGRGGQQPSEPANVQSFGQPASMVTDALSLLDADGKFIGRINDGRVYMTFNGDRSGPITIKLLYGDDFTEARSGNLPAIVYGNQTCTGSPVGLLTFTGWSTRSNRRFGVLDGNLYELGAITINNSYSFKSTVYDGITGQYQVICSTGAPYLTISYWPITSGPLNLRQFWKPPFYEK